VEGENANHRQKHSHQQEMTESFLQITRRQQVEWRVRPLFFTRFMRKIHRRRGEPTIGGKFTDGAVNPLSARQISPALSAPRQWGAFFWAASQALAASCLRRSNIPFLIFYSHRTAVHYLFHMSKAED
jgi:hypothetical protein